MIPAAETLTSTAIAANRELDGKFCQAMANKDLDGVMACLLDSPDLVVVLYGTVLRGPQAVREFIRQMFDSMESVHLKIDEVTHIPCGDAVFAVGTATYEFLGKDGTKSTLTERWTDVRREIAGQLVYVLDHAEKLP